MRVTHSGLMTVLHRSALEEDSLLLLSAADQQRFAEALINPPAPNAALKEAKRQHLETVEAR